MNIVIIGAAGMVGRKLTDALVASGTLAGKQIDGLTLVDVVEPAMPQAAGMTIRTRAVDIADAGVAATLIAERPDVIFHLAAIVSGEAELDFEKGYAINLDGTRNLFEAIRQAGQSSCSMTIPAAGSLTVSASAFPPSASVRASPTRQPRGSFPRSCASHWWGLRPYCRSARTPGTGTPARGRRLGF